MNHESLMAEILRLAPDVPAAIEGDFVVVRADKTLFFNLMKLFQHDAILHLNYLHNITCVDYKEYLEMVYHLSSTKHNAIILVKVKLNDVENPEIDSLYPLWKTAELHEDEAYDLFGVRFTNHPNLRRIFLGEAWEGYPMRKNYTDDNMIKL
ncbi:MAG: NADH-quinone oxidoreductase subunit C [Crocinitomicaceae bacterium]|nr:NADH-quinone oxidoreductase subunit C [Crocinitomicaceae bacterium]MBK8926989.1 NADH-quinone oxidoreductase subunit C [Crocinitomicaceae bacterium]